MELVMIIEVKCAAPNEASIQEVAWAIIAIAERIETYGFSNLIDKNRRLALNWRFPHAVVTDQELFAALVEMKAQELVVALRRLLQAYIAADTNYAELYANGEGIGAFAYAMRALLLFDPVNSRELFLDFLENLDMHASATVRLIFGDFVETHGLKSHDDIRLAIAVIIRGQCGWHEFRLLHDAEKIMTGAEFGAAVMAVIDAEKGRVVRRTKERGGEYDHQWHAKNGADQSPQWALDLLGQFGQLDRFGRDLRKKLSERWDVAQAETQHKVEIDKLSRMFDAVERGNVSGAMREILGDESVKALGEDFDRLVAEAEAEFRH
jgi:hypothetical protein